MKSIPQNNKQSAQNPKMIEEFFARFHFSRIAKSANAKKEKGVPILVLFTFLVKTLFSNKSAYRDYLLNHTELNFSERTFRNLLNNEKISWENLLLRLAKKVILTLLALTEEERKNVFILDDSMFERLNSKQAELSALQYDHAHKKYKRGYRFLQLGWSDGNSFLPVAFSLLSGQKQRKDASITDKRSNAGKRRELAQMKGTDAVVSLLKRSLKQGVSADYVLYDSWFSSPKMFKSLLDLGLHSIAMVKRTKKIHYHFDGKNMDVKEIFNAQKKRRGRSRYLLEVLVEATQEEKTFPVKLIYVRNRNKRNEYLVLATTDTALSADEIIQLYGKRWAIEVYFKVCKQYLRLSGYQGLSYDGIFSHTAIVCIAYMMLAVQHREEIDPRSIGEIFYLSVQALADVTTLQALADLLSLFGEALKEESSLSEETINNILQEFIEKLPKATQRQLDLAT